MIQKYQTDIYNEDYREWETKDYELVSIPEFVSDYPIGQIISPGICAKFYSHKDPVFYYNHDLKKKVAVFPADPSFYYGDKEHIVGHYREINTNINDKFLEAYRKTKVLDVYNSDHMVHFENGSTSIIFDYKNREGATHPVEVKFLNPQTKQSLEKGIKDGPSVSKVSNSYGWEAFCTASCMPSIFSGSAEKNMRISMDPNAPGDERERQYIKKLYAGEMSMEYFSWAAFPEKHGKDAIAKTVELTHLLQDLAENGNNYFEFDRNKKLSVDRVDLPPIREIHSELI